MQAIIPDTVHIIIVYIEMCFLTICRYRYSMKFRESRIKSGVCILLLVYRIGVGCFKFVYDHL